MPSKSTETLRRFNPISVPGLSKEAVDAVNTALEAMSTWRNTIADTNAKNSKQVIEKMATAAALLGWPQQIVDATRAQMQTIAETQTKIMDQIADAWEEQLKLPDPTTASPSAMLSKLETLPGFGPAGSWPSADALQKAAVNPLEFWMRFGEQWQKSWANIMTYWSKAGRPH
jgi:hypothetical protein